MFAGKRFGTICPEVEKSNACVLLGGADAYDLVMVEILIADYPNTIFVVRNFVESYNSTPTSKTAEIVEISAVFFFP